MDSLRGLRIDGMLVTKGIEKDWARLAEREGFEPSAQVLARATA